MYLRRNEEERYRETPQSNGAAKVGQRLKNKNRERERERADTTLHNKLYTSVCPCVCMRVVCCVHLAKVHEVNAGRRLGPRHGFERHRRSDARQHLRPQILQVCRGVSFLQQSNSTLWSVQKKKKKAKRRTIYFAPQRPSPSRCRRSPAPSSRRSPFSRRATLRDRYYSEIQSKQGH
jgi:hypothetical protein